MKRLMLAAVMVLLAASAGAQEVASVRFYWSRRSAPVVRRTHSGRSISTRSRTSRRLARVRAMDYGLEDTLLVGVNVTPTQHTTLASNST
jgi:hypothetical protein